VERDKIFDLLTAHADALNEYEGRDNFNSEAWLSRQRVDVVQITSLMSLLHLAQALKQVLIPVQPSTSFRSQLRHQLLHESPSNRILERPRRRVFWLGAAVLGSLLSLAGVLLFILHRLRPDRSHPMTTAV
jgi:hypothetical protein